MRRMVIDASASLGMLWRSSLSARLAASFDTCAPSLFRWEVGNVLHGRQAKDFGDLAHRKRLHLELLAPLRIVDQAGREGHVADLVAKTGLTFYDAAYLQLAIDEVALLLTEDGRLHSEAAKVLGKGRVWDLDAASGDNL